MDVALWEPADDVEPLLRGAYAAHRLPVLRRALALLDTSAHPVAAAILELDAEADRCPVSRAVLRHVDAILAEPEETSEGRAKATEQVSPVVRKPRAMRAYRCSFCHEEGHNSQTCDRQGRAPKGRAPKQRVPLVPRESIDSRSHGVVSKILSGRPVRPIVDLDTGKAHAYRERALRPLPPRHDDEEDGPPTDRSPTPLFDEPIEQRLPNETPLKPVFKRPLAPPPPVVVVARSIEDPHTTPLTANQWLELSRLAKTPQPSEGFLRCQVHTILVEKGLAWPASLTGRCTITDAGRARLGRER